MVPEEGFEPPHPKTPVPKTGVSAVPPLGPILVGRDGVEPPSRPDAELQPAAQPFGQRPTIRVVKDLAEGAKFEPAVV